MNGLKKAAMLMLVAGDDHARIVFGKLDMTEIKAITREMSMLGHVVGEQIEALLLEFKQLMGTGAGVVGTHDTATQLLSRIFDDDRAASIMDEIARDGQENIWELLGKMEAATLAGFLNSEHPQTIAVVLSNLRSDQAARVLAQLSEDGALETMMRMLRMESVQDEIMNDVEQLLRSEFGTGASGQEREDRHGAMAEIFNYFDKSTETAMLAMVEAKDKEVAETIRSLMFTFDDLEKIDGTAAQIVLRHVDNAKLALALKGAKDELKDLFLGNMSERAAKILREDMENMGPVRVKDVEGAQSELVTLVKQLVDSGEVTIASGDDDEDMIV
ncbi:MAG: flagellar motor switch protein FliG [Geminicoccaceae bacterium]